MPNKPLTRKEIKASTVDDITEEEPMPSANQISDMDKLVELLIKRYGMGNDELRAKKTTRQWLMPGLTFISVIWLLYTAVVINSLAFDSPFGSVSGRFSDAIAIAFMTTSLATVLGLWHFGLRYFFTPDN